MTTDNATAMNIQAILTHSTCGEACWKALELVCRCSCGGKNHGCLKTEDGTRPDRTAKIHGVMYRLIGVGGQWDLHEQAVALNEAGGITFHYADSSTDRTFSDIPAKLRRASATQFEHWPELTAQRDEWFAAQQAPGTCRAEYGHIWPYLLWAKI